MFTQSKMALAAVATTMMLSTAVQAREVTVEEFVSVMVSQAMEVTKQEIQNSVQEAVLSATHALSFEQEPVTYIAKVTITDIKVQKGKNEQSK